jgi:hypothetical protein
MLLIVLPLILLELDCFELFSIKLNILYKFIIIFIIIFCVNVQDIK